MLLRTFGRSVRGASATSGRSCAPTKRMTHEEFAAFVDQVRADAVRGPVLVATRLAEPLPGGIPIRRHQPPLRSRSVAFARVSDARERYCLPSSRRWQWRALRLFSPPIRSLPAGDHGTRCQRARCRFPGARPIGSSRRPRPTSSSDPDAWSRAALRREPTRLW